MLVGRGEELAQLRHRLEQGETVAVFGEAGVGKTTLLRAAAAACGRRLYEGGGLGTLSWVPYLPIERALEHRLPIGDAAWLAGEVVREVGDGVLLLDDLHWADRETRALLPYLHGRLALALAVRLGDQGAAGAFDDLAKIGVEPLSLEPLVEGDARALIGRLQPELAASAVDRIVSRAGGNPLLLEELAASGEPTESLRLALAARLRQLSPSARTAMGLLSLAGRPLDARALGEGVEELAATGLVIAAGDGYVPRHALLAETLAEELQDGERRELHGALAELLDAPGEVARHLAAAGRRELAHAAALEAAEVAAYDGERGRHLAVAAACADGTDADRLRLRAARALIDAHDHGGVHSLLDQISSTDPLLLAEVELLRYEMLVVAMQFPAARDAWKRGMDLAAGSGAEIETRLRVESGRIAFLLDGDAGAVAIAEAGDALARKTRRHRVLARYILGSAQLHAGDPGWRRSLESAVGEARRSGAESIEFRAINNLVMGLVGSGDLAGARTIATDAEARARERRLARWAQRMAVWLVAIDWHQGAIASAVERGDVLIRDVFEGLDRLLAMKYVGHALVDLGRLAPARAIVDDALSHLAPHDETSGDAAGEIVGEALSILARVEYREGRTRAALSTAERAARLFTETSTSDTADSAALVATWCRLELGLPVERDAAGSRRAEAAREETLAVRALSEGRPAFAAEAFERAAGLWRDRAFGGFLRCRWAQGESLRRAGDRSTAVSVLQDAEQLARGHGYTGDLARIERALRLCGVRRSAPRSRTASRLTGREHEVLTLVGQGLSNEAIASRLGIGRPTVARLLRNASRKLGAETRAQAAALAAHE